MIKVGNTTMKLLKAKPGSHFLFEYNTDLPIRTCRKYGVELRITRNKALGLKLVTRL
jgi:hypothetical protein